MTRVQIREDLVSIIHEMGVDTGLGLPTVIDAARAAQKVLGRTLTSHSLVAGPIDWHTTPEGEDT